MIEIPIAHYAVVHLLAGAMCGFLLQWGMVGYPRDSDRFPTALRPLSDRSPKVESLTHRTAPNPIPLAGDDDLIPPTNLPER